MQRLIVSSMGLVAIVWIGGCRSNEADSSTDGHVERRAGGAQSKASLAVPSTLAPGEIIAAPQAAREPRSGARFERLPATVTGIDFTHRVNPSHTMSHLYHSGFVCGGVAVGDMDGDGRPDIYVVSGADRNRLFRQVDDWRFEDIADAAQVSGGQRWGAGASLVDIDNDGDLDIFVCNYDAPNQLYINQGNARFLESAHEWRVDATDASLVAAFSDYDRDGDLDMYLLTNRLYRPGGRPQTAPFRLDDDGVPHVLPEFQRYYALTRTGPSKYGIDNYGRPDLLFRNDGDGTFENVTDQSGIRGHGYGLSVTWWDYNGDGWPDVYVCNDFDDPDRLYRNNGDGTFTDVLADAVPHTTWFSMGSDAGDVNNDGLLDFFAVDMSATNHYRQKTTMGAMNAAKLAAVAGPPPQYMRNALFINSGTGRFWEAAYLAGVADSDWSWAAKLADLDNDGWLDIFISNGMVRNFNDSDIPFHPSMLIGRSEWDIYKHAPPRPEQNLAFRNQGNLRFKDVSGQWGLDHVGMSFGTALADLDNDGDLDLVTMNVDEPVSVFRNQSSSRHSVTIRLRGTQSNRYGLGSVIRIETEDGQQVRRLNPMTGFLSCNEPLVHFGLNTATSIKQLSISWPSGVEQEFSDLAADHLYTICEPDQPPRDSTPSEPSKTLFALSDTLAAARHSERAYDDFQRQPLLPNKMSQLGPGIACGDVDGDGDDDFYVAGAAGQPGALWINGGDGEFQPHKLDMFERDAAAEDMGALFADIDGDEDLDLYVVSGGVECEPGAEVLRDRVYVNDGSGQFLRAAEGTLPDSRDSGGPVCAADFDRDGDLDLFVGGRIVPGQYPLSPQSHLLRNDDGKFVDVRGEIADQLAAVGMVSGAMWSDLDADGWPDLVLAIDWGPIRVFQNQAGRLVERTEEAGLAKFTGWWNGVSGRDLDGDGDIDLVATNVGRNTKYHASDEHPALLYYGDFEDNGRMRLVEAEFEDEKLFPIRGRSCSTSAMPFLSHRFRSYHDFALNDLEGLYTARCIEESHRFAANTLASGVFINDGSGIFQFRALPAMAQLAPAFGVIVSEFTGDQHADIYLVQNFFGPQPETGRMDGGLSVLLAGLGNGDFTPIGPAESGLVVTGDAKSLASTDFNGDGRQDFVVGLNDDYVKTFARNPQQTPSCVTVRLVGSSENRSAIGARVTATLSDGATQTDEVRAGSGYLSQSSTMLAFGTPAGTEVLSLDVVWPDGRHTRHEQLTSQQPLVVYRERSSSPSRAPE